MKKLSFILILLALVAVAGRAQNKYTIDGNFENVLEQISQSGISIDSVSVVDAATNEVVARGIVKMAFLPFKERLTNLI